MNQELLSHFLSDLPLGAMYYFDQLDSTNTWALKQPADKLPDRTLIVAGHQTHGRGRLNRTWHSDSEASLTFSLALKPSPSEWKNLLFLTPAAGLAVIQALEQQTGLTAQLKWPNDVLLNGKKTAGILSETVWNGESCQGAVIGIGINLAPAALPPEHDALFPATCIQNECSCPPERWELLKSVLICFFKLLPAIPQANFLSLWQEKLAFQGKRISVSQPDQPILEGVMEGLSASGDLQIRLDNGKTIEIMAGEINHLRPVMT